MDHSAVLSADNYLKAFSEIGEIYQIKEENCKAMIAEIESQYSELLNPPEEKKKQFLIPDKPIAKKSSKSKAFKKNTSVVNNKTESGSEECRRSARISMKTKLSILPENSTNSVKPESGRDEINRMDNLDPKKTGNHLNPKLDESILSICTVDMQHPVGTSTPDLSINITFDDEKPIKNDENAEFFNEKNTIPVPITNSTKKETFGNRETSEPNPTQIPMENMCNAPKVDKLRKPVTRKNGTKIDEWLGVIKETMKLEREDCEMKEGEKSKTKGLGKKLFLNGDEVKDEYSQYEIADLSEDEDNPQNQIPSWATKKKREYPISVQAWLNKNETINVWFYGKNMKNPKLEKLFSKEVRTRPRASSALWKSKLCFDESFPIL